MKSDRADKRPCSLRRCCYAIVVISSLAMAGCGGSGGTDVQPDIGAAQIDQNPPSTANPAINPDVGNPAPSNGTDNPGPESPVPETSAPETPAPEIPDPDTPDAGTPVTDNPEPDSAEETPVTPDEPNTTPTDPEAPAEAANGNTQDSALALSGSVASYPDDTGGIVASDDSLGIILQDDSSGSQSLARSDMRPVQALVSLFLLADVDFQSPVATVRTDSSGNYNVTANDVRDYLLEQGLINTETSEDEVISQFRALGRLQVRAVIVRERNGVRKAMAIQSIADPADVDESGVPKPVTVDPIVHRVVKQIVDSIRESVASLESMGLSSTIVDQLIKTVVTEVVSQIDQVLAETADEVIEIPDGLTLDDVIETQESELELQVEQQQLDQLAGVLDGSDPAEDDTALDAQLTELENVVAAADEVIEKEDSTLGSSLNSESQGLLSGFENVLNEQLNRSVEDKVNEAREAGTTEALAEVFGDRTDGVALEQALAAVDAEKDRQLRQSLRRFFLSLGLGVVIEENSSGDAGVVAVRLPLSYHLDATSLPGAAGLGEREIRLFKVGQGMLDADSEYTSDPFAELGVPDSNGIPQPPFKYVPTLNDVSHRMLQGMGIDEAQQAVTEAITRVYSGQGAVAEEDYKLLDRVEVLHELRERLHDMTLVSSTVIDTLVGNRDRRIPLKRIAATIADEFEWVSEDIRLTPDGFAIHSDRRGPLAGGANIVDSSELVRALSLTLGESPVQTAQQLTEQDNFLAQFAPRAIEFALQQFPFTDNTSLTDALLSIYPQSPAGYRELIAGSVDREAVPDYLRARDRVARGLTAALPARLYGQTLTSDSEVNIRSALFFLDYILRGEYPIDASRGFYTPFAIARADGVTETRYVPDYANVKFLEPVNEVSVAALMSDLLNITEIDDGAVFEVAVNELGNSLSDIPVVPEYQEHSVDNFIDELGPRHDLVDATCTVEMFDGTDPESGADHQKLQLGVYGVDYIESTGERLKGQRMDVSIVSELYEDNNSLRRAYRIIGLPTRTENGHGRDYVIRFEIDGYQNELPELHLYADGFVPEINLCDDHAPLHIGPDQAFFHLPGVGLVSDQSRFHYQEPDVDGNNNGNEPATPVDTTAAFEWIDLSNFEVPGAPLYVTDIDEAAGLGAGDIRLQSDGNGFSLIGPADSGVGFARLHGHYVDGKLQLSLQQTDNAFPLYGLEAAVGANARSIIEQITSGQVGLAASLPLYSQTAVPADGEVPATDALFDDGAVGDVDFNSLYLLRDREGRFWVLELRYLDVFTEADGAERAFVDIGVASINNIGLIDVPDLNYDSVVPVEFDGNGPLIEFYSLYYGDWLVLENPTDYTGSQLLPPEVLAFTQTDDYDVLRRAIDGVVIRYAGDHFAENIASVEDIESRFGTPPDFSSVPVRLEAGREGITFVKLAFDKTEKRYVMDPLPQDAARFTTQLSHNDLVAVFDDSSGSDGPVYLARVVRDIDVKDASANGQIGLEVLRYDVLRFNMLTDNFAENQSPSGNDGVAIIDEREVVCFTEDHGSCPDHYPALYSADDAVNSIGIVYDNDIDGLPYIFDPNDFDPNIPGVAGSGGGHTGGVYSDNDDLTIEAVAGVNDDGTAVRALIAKTNYIYPGEIASVELESAFFGEGSGQQLVLTCEPPVLNDFGAVGGVQCQTAQTTAVDDSAANPSVELEIYRQSEDSVSLLLRAPESTYAALGNYVDFNWKINFRAPTDITGEPLYCGDDYCPARSPSDGVITVPLGYQIPVHSHVSIRVEDEEPQDLLGLREINVDREITVTAAALPGAIEYELVLHCPSSAAGDQPHDGSHYQPEEHLRFYAPAHDEEGRPVAPEFAIHVPWLADRECRISLRSPVQTDAGEVAGVSLYVQAGVKLVGSTGSGFIDNETALKEGDNVCVDAENRLNTLDCTAQDTLFDVQSLVSQTALSGIATFNLQDNIVSAYASGVNHQLLQSRLQPDAVISFDGILDGVPASCGEVVSPGDTINTCVEGAGDLGTAFAVSSDGSEMWLLLPDAMVEGPVNAEGNIALTEPGYYTVVRVAQTAADETGLTVPVSAEVLMTISIDVYDTAPDALPDVLPDVSPDAADSAREVYGRFERHGESDFYQGADDDRQLRVSVPGYASLVTADGHEISIDTRAVIDDQLKLTFFIFEPQQLAGGHDLNGDGIVDIEVSFDNGLWSFRFDPLVDDARDPVMPEGQQFPVDATGHRIAIFDADVGYAELMVRIGDTEYLILTELGADGFGELEIIGQFAVDSASVAPLFDGLDFEKFFPADLSASSPFVRDTVDASHSGDHHDGGVGDASDAFMDSTGSTPETGFTDETPFDGSVAGADLADGAFSGGELPGPGIPGTEGAFDETGGDSYTADGSNVALTGFQVDAQRLAGVLHGRFRTAQFFNAEHLRGNAGNADCFGPQLYYQNHPDGVDAEPQIDFATGATELYPALPTGDLGIWSEYDQATGNACAAAQMDAQLDSARRRTFAGLLTLAGVARRLSPEQQADVLAGATVSMVDEMNALGLPGVVFEQASIGIDAITGDWNYEVILFDLNSYSADGAGHKSTIALNFNPGLASERWDYSGAIRFRVEDHVDTPACADSAVEHLSSLAFERVDKELLKTEYRYGLFCGHNGVNGFDSDGMVDPAYSSLVATDGWAGNFSVFTANLNPYSGAGTYAYSWQAGAADSHSRVLNVGLNEHHGDVLPDQGGASEENLAQNDAHSDGSSIQSSIDGEAWYGYGQSLLNGMDTAGEINGFICNWAGPGNDHTLIERAQRQWLALDRSSTLFYVPDGGSNITYAPVVSCEYDSDTGGDFLYDRNLDGSLADESSESVDVGAAEVLAFDLAPPASSTYFGLDIEEVIALRGFVKPDRPTVGR